jgi:hypothetical protein
MLRHKATEALAAFLKSAHDYWLGDCVTADTPAPAAGLTGRVVSAVNVFCVEPFRVPSGPSRTRSCQR